MTGRLNQLDLYTDVILVAVDWFEHDATLDDVGAVLDELDADPFPFDVPDDAEELADDLRMLEQCYQVDITDDGGITLTGVGQRTISHLTADGNPERLDAILDAVNERRAELDAGGR